MSPALTVSEAEMATALRIFGEAVADVAAEHGEILAEPRRRRDDRRRVRGLGPGAADGHLR
jgi:hypothetical protein